MSVKSLLYSTMFKIKANENFESFQSLYTMQTPNCLNMNFALYNRRELQPALHYNFLSNNQS